MWLARRAWSPVVPVGRRLPARRRAPLPPLPDGPLIFASNHESALDIWVLVEYLPRNVRFIAKRELFRIPVFGWYLRLGGHIPVDRGNHGQAVQSLRDAAAAVRAGTSLIVFPEGTRSRDGRVQPFKKGPFALAMEAGVPVVPVAVSGQRRGHAPRRRRRLARDHPVAVGEPSTPATFPDRTALLQATRAAGSSSSTGASAARAAIPPGAGAERGAEGARV